MVKRGSTTFSATKVAKAGLTATAALQKIKDLEKDVSKLRHHVSVLSKRNHGLQKEVDRLKKEEVAVDSEVASPERVEEPEPLVAAEPEESVVVANVAEAFIALANVAGVRVASVAKPSEAESRVALVVDEEGGPSAIGYPVSEGKRRRVDNSSEEGESDEEVSGVVPTGPRGGAPTGPRIMMAERVGGVRRGSGVPADLFVRRAYRFVDRTLVGGRNGMVGDTYRTRGSYARAYGSGYRGGYRGRGYGPSG